MPTPEVRQPILLRCFGRGPFQFAWHCCAVAGLTWGSLLGSIAAQSVDRSSEAAPSPATKNAQDATFFRQQVQPILQRRCWKCHDREHRKGELDLTRRELVIGGGETGPAVDLVNPDQSLLLQAVRYDGLEMPPTGRLPASEVQVLEKWIQMGAPWDSETADHDTGVEPYISTSDRKHWAFQPIGPPAIPETNGSAWCRSPVDRFVWQALNNAGLRPNGEAPRRVLARRLYFDLLGLPPTLEEVRRLEEDPRPDAYERLVDQLLASPQFGEHWARHWLDLVRFAETNSFERDNPKPNAWRYRDYVIRSLNADKSYRNFILEQLAGDELDKVTTDSLIATGFYRLGLWDDEPTDALQAYYDHLDDVVTVTGQAVMGLTINCARCHDHKIDPILQADYYRFMAFFHNILNDTTSEGATAFKTPFTLNTQRDIATEEQRAAYETFRKEFEAKIQLHQLELSRLEERVTESFTRPEQEDAKDAGVRNRLIDGKGEAVLGQTNWTRMQELRKLIADAKLPAPDFPQALVVMENGPQPRNTFILLRGNAHTPGTGVQPGFPEVLGFGDPQFPAQIDSQAVTSRQRRVLAEWLFDPKHPLTARVIVNRLWQHHFGRGLVRSSSDFGLQGDRPTHPQLLDWLAATLISDEWSLKRIHRQILLSATYRMSSQDNLHAQSIDPQNNLMWRAELRRLSAEQLRDTILSSNGNLNATMGGTSIYPTIPLAVLQGQSRPGAGWGQSTPADQNRRSVYVFSKRSLSVPLLNTFDAPDSDFSCPVRFTTTQPTQALTMLNSDELSRLSSEFAIFAQRESLGDLSRVVRTAFARSLSREPTVKEIEHGLKLISTLRVEHQLSEELAIQQFCLMVLNLNEFIYVD